MGKRFRFAFDVGPLSLVTAQDGVQSVRQRVHRSQGHYHQLWFTSHRIPLCITATWRSLIHVQRFLRLA